MYRTLQIIKYNTIIVIKVLMILSFVCLIAVVSLQVFARFLLPQAPAWTEEIARFCMIYLVSLGSGYAAQANLFMNVDFLEHIIPRSIYKYMLYINKFLCILLMAVFAFYSVEMIKIGVYQYAASIRLPMIYIFISMFILPISVLFTYIGEIVYLFRNYRKTEVYE